MTDFAGKVAMVTGGNAGIGRATAIAFAREGAKVVVAARRETEGEETVRLIQEAGGEGLFVRTDVANPSDIESLFEKTIAVYGSLDYAFNNAGMENPQAPLAEQAESDFERVMSVNLKSVWLCMKHEILLMNQRGNGALANNSVYSASKHGVLGLTKSAALEYAKQGIRVNAVCPGDIETDIARRVVGSEEGIKQYAASNLMGRWGQPADIAETVLWLCSNKAGWVTGQANFLVLMVKQFLQIRFQSA